MSRNGTAVALGAVLLLAAGPAPATPDWLRPRADYVADLVLDSGEGVLRGRIWASDGKQRREIEIGGRTHVVIHRPDRGVTWVLLPEQRMYVERSAAEGGLPHDRFRGGHLERRPRGRETVNGVDTTRFDVRGTTAAGEAFEATLWMSAHEIPVRVLGSHEGQSVRMELHELRVGSVSGTRFELPPGYRRFELPAPAREDLDAHERGPGLPPDGDGRSR